MSEEELPRPPSLPYRTTIYHQRQLHKKRSERGTRSGRSRSLICGRWTYHLSLNWYHSRPMRWWAMTRRGRIRESTLYVTASVFLYRLYLASGLLLSFLKASPFGVQVLWLSETARSPPFLLLVVSSWSLPASSHLHRSFRTVKKGVQPSSLKAKAWRVWW